MAIVAHARPFVIGVDTHARNHAVSILACPTGEIVDEAQFPATAAGLSRAVTWAGRRTGGDVTVLWVIEGTGTYGARLRAVAADNGYTVVEAPRMNARANRAIGKSDPLDARRIAAAALPLHETQLREPRADDGVRAAVKVLLASRDHMSTSAPRRSTRLPRCCASSTSASTLAARSPRPKSTQLPHGGPAMKPSPRRPHVARPPGSTNGSPRSTRSSRTSPSASQTLFARAPLVACSTSPASARSPPPSR